MGPFLDPGCEAFEDPLMGCRSFYRSLEEHRQALMLQTWRSILSYETDAMTRNQIIDASYDVAAALNELKYRHGLIDAATYGWVASQQKAAKEVLKKVEEALLLPEGERERAIGEIQSRIEGARMDTLFSKRELDWPSDEGLRIGGSLLLALARGFLREATYSAYRAAGRYDTDVYEGRRVPMIPA